ncbi:MAG: undecaprenyl-diphosphate phosphatase [Candidatus Kaiserbacteria bacterium]|nr:MAG: undecaprenyl-diphosphate phosphatase [Candidatus Kaiserbacteria bacterium]
MTIFDSIVLGVVEGITEFLPISSTGHLILASELLRIPDSEYLKTFEIAIQLGAIGSVVALYWKSFFDVEILKRLAIGFIPTGVIGLAFYGIVKTYLLESTALVLWMLLLGGVALIVFELLHREPGDAPGSAHDISYLQAALIGLFQSIAIVPGVSRSAATIVGGLLLGIRRVAIVEFSFLLAVPTMLAATGLDLVKNASLFTPDQFLTLAIGFATAFLVALLAITWLLAFVRTRSFISFGVYRIVIALFFIAILL